MGERRVEKIIDWDIDKRLDDFEIVAMGLRTDGQISRSNAMFYLMARLHLAEQILTEHGLIEQMYRD